MKFTRHQSLSSTILGLLPLALLCAAASAQSFSVAANPATVTITPGQQNVPVNVAVTSSGYTGPVQVTLSGLPSGMTVTPLTVTPGNSGIIYLSAAVNADQEAFSNEAPYGGTHNTTSVTVVGAAGSTQATSTLSIDLLLVVPSFVPTQVNLPIVTINTDGVAIGAVDVPGTITITSADGSISYLPNSSDTDNTADFHVHGHSTAGVQKQPYHISLNTSLDLLHTMGVSCPYVTDNSGKPTCDKSKSYILLANFFDRSLVRDWSASALANAIPIGGDYLDEAPGSPTPSGTSTLMPWAPHSLFVELYINGIYNGSYQLIEEVNVDSHRVDIPELTDTGTGDISGGYLMEIDERAEEDYDFVTPHGLTIGMIDPDYTPEVTAQETYISTYIDNAEAVLYSSTFTDPITGWRAYWDEASSVNFYFVNDLMGNVDGGDFFSSDYLYKNVDSPYIYMGPIWDFDISSGSGWYKAIWNPIHPWMADYEWYKQWFTDPGFTQDTANQWNALKNNGVLAAWMNSIPQQAATLAQTRANDFGRWPSAGLIFWPNGEAAGTLDGEVTYLMNWLNLRYAYLDNVFNKKTETHSFITTPTGTLRQGTPSLFSATVTKATSPTGTISFLAGPLVLGQTPINSDGTASMMLNNMPQGSQAFQAIYSGDATNALSASAPSTADVLAPLKATVMSAAASTPRGIQGGTPVAMTASLITNSGTVAPTGTIAVVVNGKTLETTAIGQTSTFSYSSNAIPPGNDTVQLVYSGDINYFESTSNAVSLYLGPETTSSLNVVTTPLVAGQQGEAIVSVAASDASIVSVGTVSLICGSVNFGAQSVSNGSATFLVQTAGLAAGNYTCTATFFDASNTYGGSVGTASAQLTKQSTQTALSLDKQTYTVGDIALLTATVSGQYFAPLGTVSFYANGTLLGLASLQNGTATLTYPVTTVDIGTYAVTARLESNWASSDSISSPVKATINANSGSLQKEQTNHL